MHMRPISLWRALLAACLTLLTFWAATAHADEYDTLRQRWVNVQTGGPGLDTSHPDIAAAVARIAAAAQSSWDSLHKQPGRNRLWDDIGVSNNGRDASANYARLRGMAVAYATAGSSLRGNAALAADIVGALDWLHARVYNPSMPVTSWADLEFGASQASMTTSLLVYEHLTPIQIANYTATVDRFVPDCSYWISMYNTVNPATGGNLVDLCLAVTLRGILGKNSEKIAAAATKIGPVFRYVTSGDGFYVDGSYIDHATHPYMGGYGLAVIGGLSSMFTLLANSTWAIANPEAANVWAWVSKAIVPLVFNGAMTDAVKGRGISRCGSGDHGTGRAIAQYLLRLAYGAPPDQAAYLRSVAKAWATHDTSWNDYTESCRSPATVFNNYYSGMAPYDVANFVAVVNDPSVLVASPLSGNFNFPSMQRVTHFAPGFGIALSMFSRRISAFECGSSENLKGWYTGAGMTYFYTADQTQFNDNFWPTVNATRLSGVTTDGSTRVPICNYEKYLNNDDWVGSSAVAGLHGSAGMQFTLAPLTGSTLTGKKSWFFFGDKMVALGSGIASTSAGVVETVVDNRKLVAAGTNMLIVNGASQPTSLGWSTTLAGVSWAHLEGNVAGSGMGYHFPGSASVHALRESRSGAWRDINTNSGPTTIYSNSFLSLALRHGTTPSDASYAYVVLPNRSPAATAAYAAAPTIRVLENSQDAHAVRDTALKVTGVNFWNDGSKTISDGGSPYVSSDRKASVTMLETANGELHVGIADPTQLNTGSIMVEIQRAATRLISADSSVTVLQLAPSIKLNVNVNASAGKTFKASVQLGKLTRHAAVADAYVRSGTHADTNYGSARILEVKKEVIGYDRQALIKFDLNGITGPVSSAKVRLFMPAVGAANNVNQAFLVTQDGWSESGISWNNRPSTSSLLGSWTATANGIVDIDVTAQVVGALAGDKLVSVMIDSAANYGSNGWSQYASRSAANGPVLLVTTP